MAIRVSIPASNVAVSSLPRFQSHAQPTNSSLSMQLQAGKGRRSVICHSTNGKPLRGDMNEDTFPAFDSFGGGQADMKPLGKGWDPWIQSGEPRNTEAETSGRDEVLRKLGNNKYGVVGNEGDEPFRIMPDGKKAYLDELDVLTLLAPPPYMKPMSTMSNYNHAAFLWKKIAAIPEERRHRLLDLLEPRHITAMWKMAELRYQDPGLYLQNASRFLHSPASKPLEPVIWRGQVNDVPWIVSFLSRFKKAFFYTEDRELYGRVITGGAFLEGLGNIVAPLYFHVKPIKTVLATNEQCDFAFSYDAGHMELKNAVPNAFPQPGKHPSPFGKEFFDYVRVVGPGVVVGQSWYGSFPEKQDPRKPGVGPRKYLGEFVLIQKYENQIL